MRNRVRVKVMIRVKCNYIYRGVRTHYSLRVRLYEGGHWVGCPKSILLLLYLMMLAKYVRK